METVQSFAAAHGGVFTRRVLMEAGFGDELIQRRVRSGRWIRLRRGIYVESDHWNESGKRQRHFMQAHAVALRCGPDLVFSHVTGAILRSWPTWNVPLDTVCAIRGDRQAGRREAGVRHFEATLPANQIELVGGLRVCSSERLMVDIAREYGFEQAVVLCDGALRDGADKQAALRFLGEIHTWPKIPGVAKVLRFADGRAENPAESRLRVALHLQGIEGFEPQVPVYAPNGRLLGRGDLVDRTNRVLLEVDGKSKYGIDGKDPREQLWQEKIREDAIRRLLHYEVLRFYWTHLDDHGLIAYRVRKAQELGRRHTRYAS